MQQTPTSNKHKHVCAFNGLSPLCLPHSVLSSIVSSRHCLTCIILYRIYTYMLANMRHVFLITFGRETAATLSHQDPPTTGAFPHMTCQLPKKMPHVICPTSFLSPHETCRAATSPCAACTAVTHSHTTCAAATHPHTTCMTATSLHTTCPAAVRTL